MKKTMRILGIVALVVVVLLVIAVLSIDFLFKKGVDYGATYALGVPTSLESADVAIFGGECKIDGLRVANPEGFTSDHFLVLNHAEVAVTLGSLLSDTVEVPRIILDGISVNLEKNKVGANYKVILDNLGRSEAAEEEPAQTSADDQSKESKKFVVRELAIRNVKVTVDLLPLKGELTRQEIIIPEIRLTNIGTGEDGGVPVSKLSGIILKAIFQSVIDGGAQIPGAVLAQLGEGLSNLSSIKDLGATVVGDVSSKVVDLGAGVGEAVGKSVEDAGKQVGDALEGVGKGLGGLLGQDKKKDE